MGAASIRAFTTFVYIFMFAPIMVGGWVRKRKALTPGEDTKFL